MNEATIFETILSLCVRLKEQRTSYDVVYFNPHKFIETLIINSIRRHSPTRTEGTDLQVYKN